MQLPIWLAHDANGDACERWVTEERQFDLSPIKTRYRNAYGQESGVIHLLWDRVPEGRLEFRF